MKTAFKVTIAIVCFSLLLSCQKSVLSDIDIDSPESLKVKVKIDEKRKKKRMMQVSIRDKTNHPVEFSNGAVFVNGHKTDFSLRTVNSTARGYNYRIPSGVHEFEITIEWNETDAHTFMVDQEAGFPGFSDMIGINITNGSEKFIITPAPFAANKISVEYDILK